MKKTEDRKQNSENRIQNPTSSLSAGQAGFKYQKSRIQHQVSSIQNQELVSVQLIVYDVLGREVATLVNEEQNPGSYSVIFDAPNLASGIYYYQIQAGSFVDTKKMLVLK